jgi:diguanylate cyclase
VSFITDKEKERTLEISEIALDRIKKDGLVPTPEIYELWFCYYGRTNTDVVRAVDALVDSNHTITDATCHEIYQRFLSDLRNEEMVRRAGEQIQTTIHDVAGAVQDVQSATSDYGQTLNEFSDKIATAKSPEEIKAVLSIASSKTKKMLAQNQLLESQLEKSTQLMDELKRDLEYVRREAMTDGLTGLANRKSFDGEMDQIMTTAREEKKIFTLLMVDIDHFKSFNDNFGHQVGDQVLRLVARTLKDGLKGRDFAARYGGEEFAIILPDTDLAAGVAVGNSLRKAIATKDVINRNTGEVMGRITMSVGVAEYAGDKTGEDIIERADGALYTAKHNGRNQVAAAPASTRKG